MNFHEQFKSIQERAFKPKFDVLVDLLDRIEGEIFIPRDVDGGIFNFLPLLGFSDGGDVGLEFIEFSKLENPRPLAGIDSSVVPIAESRDGFVLGVKGAVVIERRDGYEVITIGPLPIYISLKLVDTYSSITLLPKSYIRRAALDIGYAKRFAIDLFESMLLRNVVEGYRDLVILVDGSLISPFLRRNNAMINSIFRARDNNISIVGLSKKSKLLKKYPELYRITVSQGFPGALKVPNFIFKRPSPFKVYISLFNISGVPFRVDLPRDEDPNIVLSEIFSSSISNLGYPEVLKESHILSKISRFEVIVLRRVLEMRGAKFHYTEKLRDMLFGGFNKSSSKWGGGNEGI